MQINVRYLENLRLESCFEDYKLIADQPIRYKGDGSAPGPFDYFLASSVMCAAYFVKVYCNARNIPTEDIRVYQDNIVSPENRYKQTFHIQIELPESISDKDKKGILAAMERCSVKRVIQNNPDFIIETKSVLGKEQKLQYQTDNKLKTLIAGKDAPLEETIETLSQIIADLGIKLEIASWRNPIPNVWSVHIRDADSPICFTNGKGATKDAALCSALGEYIERIGNNYFYNDYYLGEEISNLEFVHYPNEKWFKVENDSIPNGLMDQYLIESYCNDGELKANHLIDTNSSNIKRGICALPFTRFSDQATVYIPVNLIGNLFVSNGMSAGNSKFEARVQALSEIYERAVKNKIITEEITLPDVPKEILKRYPQINAGIESLEKHGFPVYVKDASLGGQFPVMNVTIMNPKTGGVFASFGSHPRFEVALERSLTELLQGRSFEGLNDIPLPTFNSLAISEPNNIVDHFIDSTGIISWKFFSSQSEFEFNEWDFQGSTEEEFEYLINILKQLELDCYIADYTDLGANACRILVPNFSEIYPADDLIWDNNNFAIKYRKDILTVHKLNNNQLKKLVNKLDEDEIDEHMEVNELIGIAFDDNSPWSQLTVGELKALIFLKTSNLEEAKEKIEAYLAFNESLPERRMYFQVINNLIDIELNDYKQEDYKEAFIKMYGEDLYGKAADSITGRLTFYGLQQTNLNLENISKHQKLLESYIKLIKKRKT